MAQLLYRQGLLLGVGRRHRSSRSAQMGLGSSGEYLDGIEARTVRQRSGQSVCGGGPGGEPPEERKRAAGVDAAA
jgi:hypothetical protein